MTRWIVVGAGYTGARVAARLAARGDAVIVTRRSLQAARAAAPAGAEARALDLADPATLDGLLAPGDVVVSTAAPTDPAARGDAALAAAAAAGVARLVYVSSTGVYAAAAGAWVDEDFAIAPAAASGRARLAAERALAAAGCPVVALRAAGIYGADRGVIARLRAGTYRAIGPGRGAISRIHVDDLATAILAAGDAAAPGPVYNVADDDPAPSCELVDAAVAALGLPPPPTIALDAVDAEVAAMLTADRKIDNRRLKRELGVVLRYPSWRDAFADELAARSVQREG